MSSFPSPASRAVPVTMILGSCVSLQFGAALATRLFADLGTWGVTTLRLGLAAVVLAAVTRPPWRRWSGLQWRTVAVYGLALSAMNTAFYASIARIPLGPAVAVEFVGPLVLSAALSRRRIDVGCVVLALAGVSLFGLEDLSGMSRLDPWGVLLALVAGGFWAGYILASDRVGRLVPGHGGLASGLGIGALAVLPLGAGGVARAASHPQLGLLALGCSLLASVIPYSLELAAMRRLPSRVFSILLSLEPAVAALAGLILLGQPITWLAGLAIALVVAASIGTTLVTPARDVRPDLPASNDAEHVSGELRVQIYPKRTATLSE